MRSIVEFLSTNVKVKKYIDFPKKLNYDQIIDALKNFGFKEIYLPRPYDDANNKMISIAKSSTEPLLAIGNDCKDVNGDPYRFFRFCNRGKISKENPIFLLRISYDNTVPYSGMGFCTIIYPRHEDEIKTYEQFLEIIDNYF